MNTFAPKTISSKFVAALALLALVFTIASAGLAPAQAQAAEQDQASSLEATLQGSAGISLLSSSTDTSSVTGVLLGSGVTVYRDVTIDQAAVYDAALKQVIKWRQDALDDTSVKWLYNGSYVTMKEYLSKKGISQSDYLNPQWSNALERIAIQRAAEAWSSSQSHTRPNSATEDFSTAFTATYKGISSTGEILAWTSGDTAAAIDLWASEKSDYLKEINGETHGVTGHYTQLIDPSRKYYGFGHVGRTYAGESRGSLASGDSTTPTKWSGAKTFEVALSSDKVQQGTDWSGKDETAQDTMVKGTSKTYDTSLSFASGTFYLKGGTWKSSNTSVATVTSNGKVTAVADGTATITYTYSGNTFTLNLTVGQADISKATVTLSPKSYTYTGSACTPTPTVTFNGETLVQDTDYTVAYSNNVNAGTATATITGKGNYKGTKDVTFTIKPASMSGNVSVDVNPYYYEYTGSAITPTFVVTSTITGVTTTLVEGVDYTLKYSNNTEVGTAIVWAYGKGNYSENSAVGAYFSITKATPSYTVPTGLTATYGQTLADVTLPSGFTWKSSSTSVGSVGTNTFYATYTPTDTTHYKTVSNVAISVQVNAVPIAASMFTVDTAAATYTGSAITKNVSSTLTSSNYSVAYSNNTNAGTATITITGKNNYAGTLTYTFTINPASLSSASVSLSPTSYAYDGMAKKPTLTVKLGSKTLTSGTDYTVAYSDNVSAGTAAATITGKGNYTGTASQTFTIAPASVQVPTVVSGLTYTGLLQTGVKVESGSTCTLKGNTATNAGAYTATATLPDTANYVWADGTTAAKTFNWSIAKAALTATYVGETIMYGDIPALKVSVTGFVNGETAFNAVGYMAPNISYPSTLLAGKTYTLTPEDGAATNYAFTYVPGTLKVNAVDLSKTAVITLGAQSVTYTGQAQTPAVSVALASGAVVSKNDYDVAYSNNTNAGTATVTVTFKGNYTGQVEKTFNIEKATLTATYAGETVSEGEAPKLYVGVSGFVNNEVASTAKDYVAPVVTAPASMVAGNSYTLTPVGGAAANYNFTYVAGTLKVEKKHVHDYKLVSTVDPTCTQPGSKTYRCECGSEYTETIAALGHEWGEWVVTKQPTTSAVGEETRTCQRAGCGATETREVAKLDPEPSAELTVKRLFGNTRYTTMSAIANEGFAQSDVAILATGDNFPDALAASALAGCYNAPIVLTKTDTLSPEAQKELGRLGASKVFVLGGTSAVSDAVVSAVQNMNISVERVYGNSRQETSLAIYDKVISTPHEDGHGVIIASGEKFADALSISPFAYWSRTPILLTDKNGNITDAEMARLKSDVYQNGYSCIQSITIVGGTAVVSAATEQQLKEAGFTVNRIYGATRYETSAEIALWEIGWGMKLDTASIATGSNYPDALAGAALTGAKRGILLLADQSETGLWPAEGVLSQLKGSVNTLYVYGGTTVVPDAVVNACAASLK